MTAEKYSKTWFSKIKLLSFYQGKNFVCIVKFTTREILNLSQGLSPVFIHVTRHTVCAVHVLVVCACGVYSERRLLWGRGDNVGPCCWEHLKPTVHLIWLHVWLLCVQNFHIAKSFAISISVMHGGVTSHSLISYDLVGGFPSCSASLCLCLLASEGLREPVLLLWLKSCYSVMKLFSFSLLVEGLLLCCLGWLWSQDLLFTTSWVAGIIGVCHLAHIFR